MDTTDSFRIVNEISTSLKDKNRILQSGVFDSCGHPLFKSALIELLILARDLTHKSFKHGHEVAFTDDVNVTKKVSNVTMLIKYARDAACHIDSDNHKSLESNSLFSFNVAFGKSNFACINGVKFSSKYADDVCVFFGDQQIYLQRHILKAIDEAERFLKEFYKTSQYAFFLQ